MAISKRVATLANLSALASQVKKALAGKADRQSWRGECMVKDANGQNGGVLLDTGIPGAKDAMILVRLMINSYSYGKAIFALAQLYNYVSGDRILNSDGWSIGAGFSGTKAFVYNGTVHLWLPAFTTSYNAAVYFFEVLCPQVTPSPSATKDVSMPASGVTREVTINFSSKG